MSVLKSKRGKSKAEFVNVAHQIYVETLGFLSRLSARYSRILTQTTAELAAAVVDNAVAANTLLPTDEVRYNERKAYLLRSRGALAALDYHMARVYEVLMMNPEGAFSTSSGASVKGDKACARLDKMAQSLGEKIDEEGKLLSGVLKSDRQVLLKNKTKGLGASP